MLNHPTIDALKSLRLSGMAKSFEEQLKLPDVHKLTFEERLALMVDREVTERDSRLLAARLKAAKLQQQASIEDLDYRQQRGLDKGTVKTLSSCQWIKNHHNVIITGPTGIGKSYLACALGHKACQHLFVTTYVRTPRLFHHLAVARADGTYNRLLGKFARTDLLIVDDFALVPVPEEQSRDLLEVIDDRCNHLSTILVSQLPVEKWHGMIANPTIADSFLDRVVHNSYRIKLQGDSMRKKNKPAD